jgi:3-methyl-2-oxobutanoate hydroxymethyltransferase
MLPQVEKLAGSGIPVMAHIGFTPQAEHQLSGYRIQGKGDDAKHQVELAQAFEAAGAFGVLIEMVPAEVGAAITSAVTIPTVGIGAGPDCDAQVLVWQDMAGLRSGRLPRFVKTYADMRGVLKSAAEAFAKDITTNTFPGPDNSF